MAREYRAGNGRKPLATATAKVADVRKDGHRSSDWQGDRRKKREAKAKANAAPTFRRRPAEPEPSGKGTAKGNSSKFASMGLPMGTYRCRKVFGGNPIRNRTKSQDLARNLIRPEKSAMVQAMVVCSREVGAGGNTGPHTF